jgi:hypothetical protein
MLERAQYLADQAARIRVLAENTQNDRARKALIELAEGYERLRRKVLFFAAVEAEGDPKA